MTERAYENPVFVEYLVRNVALRLNTDGRQWGGTRLRRKISRASTITTRMLALREILILTPIFFEDFSGLFVSLCYHSRPFDGTGNLL